MSNQDSKIIYSNPTNVREIKIIDKKIIKKKSKNKDRKIITTSKCVCHQDKWCDDCYGEYDLFD